MMFSMRRVNAIFKKDLKDLSKNMYVGTSLILPFMLAIFYRQMDIISIETNYLIINLAFVAVAFFVQAAIIAEEKEKHTLRGLMLSPATLPEILTGKSLVSFILTAVTIILCMMILGYEPMNLVIMTVAFIVSMLFYLALGTLIGLLARTVIEASVIMLPVMFIFGFGSLFEVIIEEYSMLSFAKFFPSLQLVELAKEVEVGGGIADVWVNLVVITIWFIVSAFVTVFVFKKQEMD